MKKSVPVSIYDLECTAKDAKNGMAKYGKVTVWWDDAQNSFLYKIGNANCSKEDLVEIAKLPLQ